MILPKHFQNFEGLVDLLSESLQKREKCGIEIEKIIEKGKLKHLVVYYGLISTIKGSEEMAFIHNLVEKHEEKTAIIQESQHKNLFRCLSNQISNNQGNMFLLNIIAKSLKDFKKQKKSNIYEYILDVFKRKSLQLQTNCHENQKNCGHELGMIKSFSSNFEKFDSKPLITKTNSSNTEDFAETLSSNIKKNSDSSLDKFEKNQRFMKMGVIESFGSEFASDYSKSFQGLDLEDGESEKPEILKKLKRSESGINKKNIVEIVENDNEREYYNSLNEKIII